MRSSDSDVSRRHVIAAVVAASLAAATLFAANPVVTGPVAVKAMPGDPTHDYPFFAALEDLKAREYVEEEYFFSGTANRYEIPEGATFGFIGTNGSARIISPVARSTV